MSDMSKPNEAHAWVQSWLKESSPGRAYRTIAREAVEQRANFEACVSNRRWPGTMREESYREAVEIVEAAVEPARIRKEAWEAELARKEAEDRAAQQAEFERCRAKFPKRY